MGRLKKLRAVVSIGVSIIIASSGVSYSKITPKYKDSELVIIKKGDTLWDLSEYYYRHPYLWQRFKEYNIFTNPHWIYPGEKLAIGRQKATQITILLEEKIKELKTEKEKDKNRIAELELEIKKLKGSAEDMAAQMLGGDVLRNLVTHKEDEIMQLKKEVSSGEEENDMLKSAMLELQMKLVESQSTINMQTHQIEELTKTRNIALNAGYFLGFAAISTILAGKVVK
ncbi:MAG: LysM peptidoglycan-binding domain-containing protein [Nitrospirota bacterium]